MKNKILDTLKNDKRLWQDEGLNQTLLIDLVEEYDTNIINALFKNNKLKQQFFMQVNKVWVFKVRDFVFFMEENKVNNSFTDYKNRIGLSDGKRFLKDTQDVVLNFPFKDCILQGGQTTDEGLDSFYEYDEKVSAKEEKLEHQPNQYNLKKSKRKEIFFNQVLAKDEIDRLLDPKALTNGKKYSKDGVSDKVKFTRDESGLIKDNLIIKGNNLLALHTLKSNFAGKVKLIYIDPPYNTGNDSFNYNDNFNHSTWLAFMKNRLEVARELLSDDGIIFISCDDNEQAYLKVLMDDVFGRNNFVGNLIVISAPAGTQSSQNIAQQHSYCLGFSKSESYTSHKLQLSQEKLIKKYKERDEQGSYYIERLWKRGVGGKKEDVPSLHFPVFYDKKNNCIYIDDEAKDTKELITIIPYQTAGVLGRWTWSKTKMMKEKHKLIVKVVGGEYKLHKKVYIQEEKGKLPDSIIDAKIGRTEMGSLEIKEIFKEKVFAYPKPERLLERIIELSTKKGDLVLDYHLGSGTTCAVAHKMGRQYIGIEQMDYIEDIAVKRMQKVIEGEQGGISKSVDWQGGGEFVYCELAKWNENAKEKILACKDLNALINLFDDLYHQYFLNYNLKIKEFKEKVIKEDNFKNLDINKQKEMFLTMLDLNQMSVNKSEMADNKYNIDEKSQKFTSEFYNKNKE